MTTIEYLKDVIWHIFCIFCMTYASLAAFRDMLERDFWISFVLILFIGSSQGSTRECSYHQTCGSEWNDHYPYF